VLDWKSSNKNLHGEGCGLMSARQSGYSELLERVFLPAYYGLRGRTYARHRAWLEKSQWWNAEQLAEFQWSELQRLLKHAIETVPYYRQKYAAAGVHSHDDVRTREHFARLPALTRAEVNEHARELCSTGFRGRLLPHATGGSSGVPTRFFITHETYDWRTAISARAYSWAGARLGERMLYLWGGPVKAPSRVAAAKLGAYRWLRSELVINTFVQSEELWRSAYEVARKYRPRFVVGYVSSIERFCEFLLANSLTLPGIQAAVAAAEMVTERARRLVREALQCALFDVYGCREFMCIAAECEEHRGLHICSENILLEERNESPGLSQALRAGEEKHGPTGNADGAVSDLLITDLHNYGMPFLRYEIGDVGRLAAGRTCACGRGLPMLEQISGRSAELLRLADGRSLSPLVFFHVIKDIPEISEFQLVQRRPDVLELRVVVKHGLREGSEKMLREYFEKLLGSSTKLRIVPVTEIPLLASGKRQTIVVLKEERTTGWR
jgi:phenylacetate-CoA ligase